MSVEIIKKDSELLFNITERYLELLKKGGSKSQKKKIENYINSLLIHIERNINENVRESTKNIETSN